MDDEPEPSLTKLVFGFLDSVRQLVGFVVLLAFAIAYVVMGNTAGRLIGVVLLVGCIAIGISLVRRRSAHE